MGRNDRANHLMIIGAALLAVIAGVIIFVAVSQSGGDDSTAKAAPKGDASVLVAKDTIAAGTKLTPDMVRVATFTQSDLVPDALSDPKAIIGLVARGDILQGQQISKLQFGQVKDADHADELAFKIPDGKRAMSVSVNEPGSVTGLFVPGDRVDIIVTIKEKQAFNTDQQFLRVHTVLQNVQVLARAKEQANSVVTLGADGQPIPDDQLKPDLAQRPDKVDTDVPSTVTLALTPDEVQQLVAADALGDITLTLRKFGEDAPQKIDDIVVPVYQ
jgi:pilus assembly protein CpaB